MADDEEGRKKGKKRGQNNRVKQDQGNKNKKSSPPRVRNTTTIINRLLDRDSTLTLAKGRVVTLHHKPGEKRGI